MGDVSDDDIGSIVIRLRIRALLDECLEAAVAHAQRRAYKHDDAPITEDRFRARVAEHVEHGFWQRFDDLAEIESEEGRGL